MSWSLRSCPVSRVDVGVSSAVLVSCQDEARSANPPRRRHHHRRSPLPPIGTVSDLRLQQSPLCQRRQQVSHPGTGRPGSFFFFKHTCRETVGISMLDLHRRLCHQRLLRPFSETWLHQISELQSRKSTQTQPALLNVAFSTFS